MLAKDNNLERLLNDENLNETAKPNLDLNSQENQAVKDLRKELSDTNSEGN